MSPFAQGLQIIDISNPAEIDNNSIIASCDTPGNAMDVAVSSYYAYVADESSGLQVIRLGASE